MLSFLKFDTYFSDLKKMAKLDEKRNLNNAFNGRM